MFKKRSYKKELMDDLELASDALEQNLQELEIINTRLGGYKVTLNALKSHLHFLPKDKVRIMDIGSGAGDTVRKIASWGRKIQLNLELTGIDANSFMIQYAQKRCEKFKEISFSRFNALKMTADDFDADVISMNLFCHHFTDEELIEIFSVIADSNAKLLIINDLHRHPLAYYSIKLLTRFFNGSYLVKNDAPLSVLRGFKKNEMSELFVKTNFKAVEIKWFWAFRWQVCAFTHE